MTLTNDDIVAIIEDAGTQIDMDKLQPDTAFEDIGADSLDIMNILLGVQEKTGAEVPDEDVEKLGSINAILAYVNNG